MKTEALTLQQRLQRARIMKRNRSKIAMGRRRAMRRTATQDVLQKRAQRTARNMMLQKILKGVPKDELTMQRKADIEKRLDKMKPRIDKLARKLLPQIKKAELARKSGA